MYINTIVHTNEYKYIAMNYDNAIIKLGAGEAPPYPAP